MLSRAISRVVVALLVLGPAAPLSADSLPCPQPDSSESSGPIPAEERIAELFPGFGHARELPEPFPHLAIHDSTGTLLGYQLDSDLGQTTAPGFIGPVPVRIFCDTLGLLVGIDVLDNLETPGYIRFIESSDLLDRLLKYRAGTKTEIDAVTLATHTSLAVIQGVVNTVDALFSAIEPDQE